MFFGNTSTGGANGTAYLPPFWQFDGNAMAQPIVFLSIYVIVFAALVIYLSWGRLLWWRGTTDPSKRREDISPAEEVGIAAVPPG